MNSAYLTAIDKALPEVLRCAGTAMITVVALRRHAKS